MNDGANVRPSAIAKGYMDALIKNGSFSRSIDAYVFAAAFAMRLDLDNEDANLKARGDLVAVRIIDDEVRLALECSVLAIRKRKSLEPLVDGSAVLEQVTKYAEVGLVALKQRWEGKTSLQIQHDIKNLLVDV